MSIVRIYAPSWGRLDDRKRLARSFAEGDIVPPGRTALAYGQGRSYGDTCHNDDAVLLTTGQHQKIISFDTQTGILQAQAGAVLADILSSIGDSGWFLPVVPGTKFVTLGGAIANDIHGKNHQTRGTFGCHVKGFQLWRSDTGSLNCSRQENAELFNTTIGGLGLTGVITHANIQLMKVPSHFVQETRTPFASLEQFFERDDQLHSGGAAEPEYSVAWVDSLAKGAGLGRGVMITANHIAHDSNPVFGQPRLKVPFTPPIPLVSGLPLRLFNQLYFHRNSRNSNPQTADPNTFFFPLDAIAGWNRLYGPLGLFQHQSIIPAQAAFKTIRLLIKTAQDAGQGSFLTVLKRFGQHRSPGLMSFPQPGYTLTLDFANRGQRTLALLDDLDRITLDAGGRTNPYKDARMSAETFQAGYPSWQKLENLRDPLITSNFWKRTTTRRHVAPPPLQTPSVEVSVNQVAKRGIQKDQLQAMENVGKYRSDIVEPQ